MASYTLKIPHSQRPPSSYYLSSSGDSLALLWSSPIPVVEIWDLKTRRVGGRGKVMAPILVWKESFPDQSEAWQVTLSGPNEGPGSQQFCVRPTQQRRKRAWSSLL
jgi:hypothetical protein